VRTTYSLVLVAATLMAEADRHHWGYELSRQSGVRSGVMYPILTRMLQEGWLEDGWEAQTGTSRAKRPPRRYYRLTLEGKAALSQLLNSARRDARFTDMATRLATGSVG